MDRGLKIVIASCILAGGIGAAMLFRRPSPPARRTNPRSPDSLVLRDDHDAPSGVLPLLGRLTAEIAPPGESESAAERAPSRWPGPASADRGQPAPPPSLARSYPRLQEGSEAGWPPSTSQTDLSSGKSRRRHTIVDGDTLVDLAERYLGDADRYLEIYRANRDVLPSPEVLPIGAELEIPPKAGPRSPQEGPPPRGLSSP